MYKLGHRLYGCQRFSAVEEPPPDTRELRNQGQRGGKGVWHVDQGVHACLQVVAACPASARRWCAGAEAACALIGPCVCRTWVARACLTRTHRGCRGVEVAYVSDTPRSAAKAGTAAAEGRPGAPQAAGVTGVAGALASTAGSLAEAATQTG